MAKKNTEAELVVGVMADVEQTPRQHWAHGVNHQPHTQALKVQVRAKGNFNMDDPVQTQSRRHLTNVSGISLKIDTRTVRVFNSIQKSGKMRITSVEDFLKGPFAAMKEELKRPLQPPPRDNRSEKSEVCPLTSTKRKGPGRAERGVKRLAKRQAYRVAVRLGGMHSRCACPHASRCSFGESSCLSGMELSRRRSSVGF